MPYIPNNAYLIAATASAARAIAADPQTQIVLPWEPPFKLEQPLLKFAVEQQALPDRTPLKLLLLPKAPLPEFQKIDPQIGIIRQEISPFGPIVTLQVPASAS